MTQVILLVDIEGKPGKNNDIAAILKNLEKASKQETGCELYEFIISKKSPDSIKLLERWRDNDSLLLHRNSLHLKQAFQDLEPFLAMPVAFSAWLPL